jgi:poly(hydroxyalkanoate) depolymerase family esterase
MQKVDRGMWSTGGVPDYVNMYVYVPDKVAAKPPILVASHHCGGSASSTFNETRASFVSLADQHGFVIVIPEATGHNCWDVGSAQSLKHDGGGDTHAIAQMVRYALTKYSGDASRVYAFGTSSGAMMTQALLGVYPDLFAAGVAAAGVACGCWAEQYTANNQWSGPCAGGMVKKSGQQWGDLVRSMFPEYKGHRPRVQLWHGTADTTINFNNLTESIKQWTNVLSLSEAPTTTDSQKAGFEHKSWKSECGFVVLDTWAQQGAGHDVAWDSQLAAAFLGLDKSGGADPEAAACPSGGDRGMGGMSGAAGAAGTMNTAVAGSSGASGTNPVGGANGGAGASASVAGSSAGTAGRAGSAATSGAAGTSSSSGAAGRGMSTNGIVGSAGGVAAAAGAVAGTSAGHARSAAMGVNAGAPDLTTSDASSSGGCSLNMRAARGSSPFLLVALGFLVLRRRARRSVRQQRERDT